MSEEYKVSLMEMAYEAGFRDGQRHTFYQFVYELVRAFWR